METETLENLRARAPAIYDRWEALLRIERPSGPLANPETLKLLIPQTITEVLKRLSHSHRARHDSAAVDRLQQCDCGCNPYLTYFIAGEQAFVESVILLQSEQPPESRLKSDVGDVIRSIRHLARDEFDTFCGICMHRGLVPNCPHPAPSPPVR